MMKLYAIRDRMLDYFQNPVAVTRQEDFLAAVARNVNGETNELAQAPDHYEVWEIAEIDDQGRITPKREFIANCSRFIRSGVWNRRKPGSDGIQGEPGQVPNGPGRIGGGPGAVALAPEGTKGSATVAPQEPDTDARGSYPGGQGRPRDSQKTV